MLVMRICVLLISLWSGQLVAAQEFQVFISFSMPKMLLEQTIKDAANHNVPVVLNGLYQDSMQKTAVKLFELAKKAPNASIQIDPIAFEKYGINQVPAFVASKGNQFDVVMGNISIDRAMSEINTHGELRGIQ